MFVTYIGGQEYNNNALMSYPLEKGKRYEVEDIYEFKKYVPNVEPHFVPINLYSLKGTTGLFDSSWFKEIHEYIGFAPVIPQIGKKITCKILDLANSRPKYKTITIQYVYDVHQISETCFEIISRNSLMQTEVYFLQVQQFEEKTKRM